MRLFLLLLFVVWSAPAQGAEPLRLLTWQGYAPPRLVERFTQETGINVSVTYSNNEEMIPLLRAPDAPFDLVQPSQDRIAGAQKAYGLYQPIDLSRVRTELFDPVLLSATLHHTSIGTTPYAVPFCWGTSGLIVNTAKAPDATDYDALLDPAYKGRISYRLKRPTLIALAFSLGENPFHLYGSPQHYEDLITRAANLLMTSKPLVAMYWNTADELRRALLDGTVHVAMGWDNDGWALNDQNPDITFVVPASGALGWMDTFAIPEKATNIDGAYAWINFMMRPDNAAAFSNLEFFPTASRHAHRYLDDRIRVHHTRTYTQNAMANIKWYPPVSDELESIEAKILDSIRRAR